MPKPMRIDIEVEEIAFGAVFRKLKNMEGVVSIDLEAEPDKPAAPKPGGVERYRGKKKPGTRGSDKAGTSLRCILLDYITRAKRPCPTPELKLIAIENGFSEATFNNVSFNLRKAKLGKKTGKGWVLTAAGTKYLETECKLEPEE